MSEMNETENSTKTAKSTGTVRELNTKTSIEYLSARVQQNTKYCGKQAKKYGRLDRLFSVTIIILTAAITVLAGVVAAVQAELIYVISGLAALATVMQGIKSAVDFKAKEIFYAQTYAKLNSDHLLFVTGTFPYDSPDPKINLQVFAKKVSEESEEFAQDVSL